MTITMKKEPLVVHCGKCHHEWALAFLPLPASQVGKLGKARCPACNAKDVLLGPHPKPTPEGEARAWIDNGDTGLSSETIWSVLSGWRVPRASWHADVPHDPADFGRCYRLLQVMPAWRARLPEVAVAYPQWAPLVDAWDELTALYEAEVPDGTGRAPRLYARLQELTGREADA